MWNFWWTIFRKIPRLAWDSTFHSEAVVGGVLTLIQIYNVAAGEQAVEWVSKNGILVWVGIGVVFLHLVMKSVWEEFESRKKRHEESIGSLRNQKQKEIDRISHALREADSHVVEQDGHIRQLEAEITRLKELNFWIDYRPKSRPTLGRWIHLIVGSGAKSRTIHRTSMSMVECESVPEIPSDTLFNPRPIPMNDNGETLIDLNAGNVCSIPFIKFEPSHGAMIQGLGLVGFSGCFSRITVLVTGQNAEPEWATFMIGFDKQDHPFFKRLRRISRPVLRDADDDHPPVSESD